MSNRPVRCKREEIVRPAIRQDSVGNNLAETGVFGTMNVSCVVVIAGVLSLCGCTVNTAVGPAHNDFSVFERDDAESLKVNLRMGAGEVRVGSGTEKLARADFLYNIAEWKPSVRYSNTARRGLLNIEQPSTHGTPAGNVKYEWDLRLNRDVPIDLEAHLGAGSATLDLGGLTIQNADINMGVGELKMDLRGQPKRDYSVHIQGGVGEATVHLPADVGIYAEASGGIGEISATGLRREDGHFRNDAYGHAKTTIRLNVKGGIGSIRLVAE